MGSIVELNDTLQISTGQGFPAQILDLSRHRRKPIELSEVEDMLFHFVDKPGVRIFHTAPVRVYLVHNLDGRWLFWGHADIESQTIAKKLGPNGEWKEGDWITSGTFTIRMLYDPDYQREFTHRESPPGLSYFDR
jgi:hypothetical protein